jgi:hypothetical protein
MMLGMVFDPRYRSFATSTLWLPALFYLVRPVRAPRREIGLLAFIVGAGIVPQLFREGLSNPQAWAWAVVSVLMTLALWRSLKSEGGVTGRPAFVIAGTRARIRVTAHETHCVTDGGIPKQNTGNTETEWASNAGPENSEIS